MQNRLLIRVAIISGAVLVVALIAWAVWPTAAVEGETPADRVDSIAKIADEEPLGAARALSQVVRSSREDPTVRQAALVALARFPRKQYRPVVEEALGDPLAAIRASAANTLGTFAEDAAASDSAADRLGAMVLDRPDPDPTVRIGAIRGLGLCPSPKALAWLVRIAEQETTPAVHRQAVLEAYNKVGKNYYWTEAESEIESMRRGSAESLKGHIQVRDAYRYASWPLVLRPEYAFPSAHKEH